MQIGAQRFGALLLVLAIGGCSSTPRVWKGAPVFVENIVCASTIDSPETRRFAAKVDARIRELVTEMGDVVLLPSEKRADAFYVVKIYLTEYSRYDDPVPIADPDGWKQSGMRRTRVRGVLVRIPREEDEQAVVIGIPQRYRPAWEYAFPDEWETDLQHEDAAAKKLAFSVAIGAGVVQIDTFFKKQDERLAKPASTKNR